MNENLNIFAQKLIREGENSKALIIYKYLCKVDFNLNNLINYCKTLIKSEDKKNIVMAIKLLNDLIDNLKLDQLDMFKVKKLIGNAYCNLKEFEIARVFYENSLKIKENDDAVLANIAISYYLEENYPISIRYFNLALKQNQTNVEALSGLALVYYNIKNYELSYENFIKSFKINPNNSMLVNMLCKLYFENNIEFDIKNIIQEYLKYDSLNVDILYLYSVVLFKQKEYKLCEVELLKIMAINPDYKLASDFVLFLNKTLSHTVQIRV